jgi:hypothetical protein
MSLAGNLAGILAVMFNRRRWLRLESKAWGQLSRRVRGLGVDPALQILGIIRVSALSATIRRRR